MVKIRQFVIKLLMAILFMIQTNNLPQKAVDAPEVKYDDDEHMCI